MDIFGVNPLDFLDFRMLSLLAVLSVGGVFIWFQANKRYPKITFLVFSGLFVEKASRRLYGQKVVPDDLLKIMMNGENLIGLSITSYTLARIRTRTSFQNAYLAENVNGELLPLRKETQAINVVELVKGREQATAFINVLEQSREQLDKVNPFMSAIYAVLPLLMIVGVFGLMMYLLVGYVQDGMKANLQIANQNLQLEKQIAERLTGVPAPQPVSPITQNQTISNGGAVYGR